MYHSLILITKIFCTNVRDQSSDAKLMNVAVKLNGDQSCNDTKEQVKKYKFFSFVRLGKISDKKNGEYSNETLHRQDRGRKIASCDEVVTHEGNCSGKENADNKNDLLGCDKMFSNGMSANQRHIRTGILQNRIRKWKKCSDLSLIGHDPSPVLRNSFISHNSCHTVVDRKDHLPNKRHALYYYCFKNQREEVDRYINPDSDDISDLCHPKDFVDHNFSQSLYNTM